jgi:hypothetical protein
LDLSAFYNQLLSLAKLAPGGGGVLTQQQMDALGQVYRDSLSKLVARIVDRYNEQGTGERLSASYRLSAAELAVLNRGDSLSIDFVERCVVPRDREAVEINSVTLSMNVAGMRRANDTVRLRLQHSGESRFKRGERNWLFRHASIASGNPFRRGHPFRWELEFDSNLERLGANPFRQTQPSLGDNSLLQVLLADAGRPATPANMLLFSRAGLWADLYLSREDFSDVLAHYEIDDVLIRVDYDFRRQPQQDFAVLDIEAMEHPALRPLFVLDRPDLAGRKHGIGRMVRTFGVGSAVELSTPTVIGSWHFKEWRGCAGRPLPLRIVQQATSPKITVFMDENIALQAVYESKDTDEDGLDDAWEMSYFGNLSQHGGLDLDRDRVTNLSEFLTGTNPVLADSDSDGFLDDLELRLGTVPVGPQGFGSIPFVLHGLRPIGPDRFAIVWEARVLLPKGLILESASSLDNPVWNTLAFGQGTLMETEIAAVDAARFFRLRLPN